MASRQTNEPHVTAPGSGPVLYRCAKRHEFEAAPGLLSCPAVMGVARRGKTCGARLAVIPPEPDPLAGLKVAPELTQALAFGVWCESPRIHDCGPIEVKVDPAGIEIQYLGAEGPPEFKGSWDDLCGVLWRIEHERQEEANRKRVERRRRRDEGERRAEIEMRERRTQLIAGNVASIRVVTCSEEPTT